MKQVKVLAAVTYSLSLIPKTDSQKLSSRLQLMATGESVFIRVWFPAG